MHDRTLLFILSFFRILHEEECREWLLQALASFLKPQNASRGTHLTRQGGPAESVYFLQRGQVEVMNLGETVGMLHGPTVFGEAALLKDVSEPAKVRLSGYRTYTTCMCVAYSSLSVGLDTRSFCDASPTRHGACWESNRATGCYNTAW